MPYGGIINNGVHRVSSATASVQRNAGLIDGQISNELSMRIVGMSKLIVNAVQTAGALNGSVSVQGKVGDDAAPGWFVIDGFALPALNTNVHRSYDVGGFRLARLVISNPAGAGAATYNYMMGASI